jgi:hypothetical protein
MLRLLDFFERHPHAAASCAGLLMGLVLVGNWLRPRPLNVAADNFATTTGWGCTFDLTVDGQVSEMEYVYSPKTSKAILMRDGGLVASSPFELNGSRVFKFVLRQDGKEQRFKIQFYYVKFATDRVYEILVWCNGKVVCKSHV